MGDTAIKVFMIEDNLKDTYLIRHMLEISTNPKFVISHVQRLSEGLAQLKDRHFDVVLLDLGLPDSQGIDTLRKVHDKDTVVPIIVLTGLDDQEIATQAIRFGGQDYLIKGQLDSGLLMRSIRYAIERKRADDQLRSAKDLSDALNRLNVVIHSTLELDKIMQRVIAEAAKSIGTDASSLGLFEGERLIIRYVYNMPESVIGQYLLSREAKGAQYAASVKDVVAFNDAMNDERLNPEMVRKYGIRSMMAAPLIIKKSVLGIMNFFSLTPFFFTETHLDFIRKLSASLSLALENARLYDERREMEEAMRHMAQHDALTGLPNRRLFNEIIHVELAQMRRHNKKLAVLFLDLDRFKEINDTLGHDAGDALLTEAAARLKSTVRESDTVARIGGDEFNLILSDIDRPEYASEVGCKLLNEIRKPFKINGHAINVSTSIGISVFPDDGEDGETLLRFADIAMYHAKDKGRNNLQFYNPVINTRSVERMKFENSLRQALERNEFRLYYQPLVNVKSRNIVSGEALLRWQHPERGLLLPEQFFATAEDIGLLSELDAWVLNAVAEQINLWSAGGLPPICVTVNVSARQFESSDLVKRISGILEKTGLPAECLSIEITETVAMQNIESTIFRLDQLANMGVNVSIDDFGTGYSSLSRLKRLRIRKLKIDRSFIRDIASNSDDRKIITAVLLMAHSMKLKVVAEGVEDRTQFSFLRALSCDEAQGFFFSKPLPAEEFKELVTAGK